ncbi:MAG: hypothetical protein K6C36_00655 [Clostridia bacterium]|nr:hypothetical protein [Clostridia bacterium]
MKKIFVLLLAVLTAVSFAACGGKTVTGDVTTAPPADDAAQSTLPAGTEAPADPATEAAATGAPAPTALLPGELYRLGDPDNPVLTGLSLAGNRYGSTEFNSKPAAAEGIRCVFELNEWVEVTPEAPAQDGLAVWVFSHREDPDEYRDAVLSEETDGFAAFCDLPFDPEAEANASRGSFYLNPDDAEPGYYDLVFTFEGKPEALMLARFFSEGELDGRSDTELQQMIGQG